MNNANEKKYTAYKPHTPNVDDGEGGVWYLTAPFTESPRLLLGEGKWVVSSNNIHP